MNLTSPPPPVQAEENVFSFNFARDALLERLGLVVAITIVGLTLGIAYVVHTGGSYQISMTLIPAETDTEKTGVLDQLPSFLSSGSDVPVSKFKQFQTAIYATGVAALMDKEFGTLCRINANRCDFTTRRWTQTPEWRTAISRVVRLLIGMPPKPATPQISDLADYIRKNVDLSSDKSSVMKLTMNSKRADSGVVFLSHLVLATNQYIRDKDRANLNQYVQYLSDKLERLTSVGQRSALDTLLLTEERRLMLTQVQVAYAAAPLDGPNAVPANSISFIALCGAISLGLSCLLTLIMKYLGWNKRIRFIPWQRSVSDKAERLSDA